MAIKHFLFNNSYTNISDVTVFKSPLKIVYAINVYADETKKERLFYKTFYVEFNEMFPAKDIPFSILNLDNANSNIFKLAYGEFKKLDCVTKYKTEDC